MYPATKNITDITSPEFEYGFLSLRRNNCREFTEMIHAT
jgi:hypothetical protein